MDLKSVIFDLDGTLVDSLPGIEHSVDHALKECGYPVRSVKLRPLIGPPIRRILGTVTGEQDTKALDRLESEFRRSYDSEGWKRTILRAGAKTVLNELCVSGTRLFMVTNKPSAATHRILDQFRLTPLFSRIVCPDTKTPPYRSKAEMIGALADEDGVCASNSIMVGDTTEDFEAAQAFRIPAAIFTAGYGDFAEQPPASSFYSFGCMDELSTIFARAGGHA